LTVARGSVDSAAGGCSAVDVTEQPRLCGRLEELALLQGHLNGAGDARLVEVAGEAGIGKTALLAAASEAADGLVLSARCLPWSSPMSLQPFADLVRAVLEEDASWAEAAVDGCPPYVRSSMGVLLPELAQDRELPAPLLPDEYARPRLFAAVRAFWIAAASVRSCALVIDDAHWADPTSLDLVEFLLAQPGGELPPLVLTFRTEPPGKAAANAEQLRRIEGAPRVQRVRLFGLSREDTAALIAAATGAEPSVEHANAIFARSEGHPLFATQLATAPPGQLPRALTDLFDAALAALDEDAARLAQGLAVAMRPMELSWLCQVSGLPEDNAQVAVRRLEQHHLLRPATDGRVDLRHALLAELVRARLPDLRRREISGRLAAVMAGSSPAAELATLWGDAGNRDEELSWRVRAATDALQRQAATVATSHWSRALELVASRTDEISAVERLTGLTMAALYSEASEAAELSGDPELAAELALQALEHTDPDDLAGRAEALRRAGPLVGYRTPDRGRKMLDEAIELYQQLPASPGLALAYRRRAFQHKGKGHHDEGAVDIGRGLEVADQHGSPEVRRRLLADSAWSVMEAGDLDGALARMRAAWAIEVSVPDVGGDIFLGICHSDILLKACVPAAEVAAAAAPGLRAIEELSLDEGFRVSVLRSNVAEALMAEGDPDAARDLLGRARIDQITSANWVTGIELVQADLMAGRLEAATARLQEVSALALPGIAFRSETAWREAELWLWSGRHEKAFQRLQEVLGMLSETRESRFSAYPFVLAARAAREWNRRRSSRHPTDRQSPPDSVLHLTRLRDRASVDPFAGPVPADAEAHGAIWAAELAEVELAPAPELWSLAAETWEALPRPHPRAYCLMRYAETLLTTSRARTAAAVALAEAHALARQHRPLREAIVRIAHLGGLTLDLDAQPTRGGTPHDLTSRELDVLRLLVGGLSNAQIGGELFMSPKTASVHVTHILSKLQARTRAHAATIAIAEGLVSAPTGSSPRQPSS
jgi:DNA-binding CsgD family transcriptional regulator/tetratricopeptide (TPR) repeat protein